MILAIAIAAAVNLLWLEYGRLSERVKVAACRLEAEELATAYLERGWSALEGRCRAEGAEIVCRVDSPLVSACSVPIYSPDGERVELVVEGRG